jgi:hypothetical protein
MRPCLLLPLFLLSGCAWDSGEGFAVLEPSVRAAYTSEPSRAVGDGYQRLSSDFQVRLTTAAMRLERIELTASSGGGGGGSFDPASPPPGYSLCHNGHCHRDDGALIDYEDVAAELGGGGTSTQTVATLPVGDVNLLAPETRAVTCTPDCELPSGEVSRGRWALTALALEGTVRDGRAPPRFEGERRFRLAVSPGSATAEPIAVLEGDLEVPSDREHAPRVLLALQLEVTARIFDDVDWALPQPGSDGTVDLNTEANAPAREAVLKSVAELAPSAEVAREDR